MLAAPLKSSNKALNWEAPLREYIASNYGGSQVAAAFAQDFQILNNARQRATQVIVGDEASLEALKKYLAMLSCLETKFPVLKLQQDGKSSSEFSRLQFTWSDALRPKQKPLSLSDIDFERSNVMYNLAALESLAGINHDLKTLDSIKQASGHFSRAAGIFAHLEESPELRKMTVTCDLSPEALAMLKNLMLAQTQVCFFERAVMEDMRPSILSKVAFQSFKFFDKALDCAKTAALSKALDPAWSHHLEFHKRKHEALAHYYHSLAVKQQAESTGNGFGDLVAWFRQADQVNRAALKWGTDKSFPQGTLLPLRHTGEKIAYELQQAEKDNETIYFASVPTSLPPLVGHVLAKQIDFTQNASAAVQLFKNLYQPWMLECDRAFQRDLQHRTQELGSRVEHKISEVRQGLQDANLPASVEVNDSEDGIPSALWARIGHGTGQLEQDFAANVQSREFLETKLFKLERDLQLEAECDSMGRIPSHQLNGAMYQDLNSFKALLAQAKRSDEALQRRIATEFPLLNYSKQELDAMLPPTQLTTNNPKVDKLRMDLSLLLIDLGSKIVECEQAQIELTEASAQVKLLPRLTREQEKNDVKQQAMEELTPLFSKVEAKLGTVQAVFSKVLEMNFAFQEVQTEDDARKQRVGVLHTLDTQIGKHRECVHICREGAKFYVELGTQIQQLGEVVEDFCFVRNLERDEAMEEQRRANPPPPPAVATVVRPPSASMIHINVSPPPRRPSTTVNPMVASLRNALGVDSSVSDAVLESYIQRANGDVNEAAMAYFEEPPAVQQQAPPVPGRPAPAIPQAARTSNVGMGGGGGGWFQ